MLYIHNPEFREYIQVATLTYIYTHQNLLLDQELGEELILW